MVKKIAIVAVVAAAALFLGLSSIGSRTEVAQAKPTSIVLLNPYIVNWFIGSASSGTGFLNLCGGDRVCDLRNPADLAAVANYAPGADADGVIEASDFAVLAAYSAGQLVAPWPGTLGTSITAATPPPGGVLAFALDPTAPLSNLWEGTMWVLVFTSTDENIALTADTGTWLSSYEQDCDSTTVGDQPCQRSTTTLNGVNASSIAAPDEDCNANGVNGDGVCVDMLVSTDATNKGSWTLDALQAGVDVTADYKVVGIPQTITLTALENNLETGGAAPNVAPCNYASIKDPYVIPGKEPKYAGVAASVADVSGTQIVGWPILFSLDIYQRARLAASSFDPWTGVAVGLGNSSSFVTIGGANNTANAYAMLCGNQNPGDVIVTAMTPDVNPLSSSTPKAKWWANVSSVQTSTKLTVVGPPAKVTLAADPATLVCDGKNSSTVTATVVDANGKPVADGNKVDWQVVALGNADPEISMTAGFTGKVTTKVTPLSSEIQGVTVIAASGEAQGSLRVDCTPAFTPTAVPAPSGTTPTVKTPNTGFGTTESGSGYAWLALVLGGLVLAASGVAVRKVTR